MATERKFVFWTFLFALHCINTCTSQRLDYDSATCSGPDELDTLKTKATVQHHAIKWEILEEELNSVMETLSKLDQANKTEMLEKELNSVKETLSKLNQANKTEMIEKELNSVKKTLSKLDQANKMEMLETELNSVKETLSKHDQANKTEKLEKEFNSVKETLTKLDQANKTEMLETELNSVKETLSKLDQANKTENLEKELNSVKETLSKLDQANKTEMLETELNSVKETLSKLDQANKTENLEKELNSVKETLSKLDQANKTEMLETELNSVKETLSKLDHANKTEMLEKELNSVKETLSKLDQANKTENLEKELNSVKETLSKLDHANKTEMHEKELNSVKETLSKLDQANKTEMLEKELNSVKETLSKLNQANKMEMIEKKINLVEETVFKLYQSELDQAIKTEMLEKELNSVKEALSILSPDQVAFHVVAYSNSSPGVIIFDNVITNIKFGYDRRSGIFTVPITGLYGFSWNIETCGQLTEGVLLVNGLEMGISKSDQAPTYYDTTASFAVLNLTRKDKVWIRIKSGRAEAMHTMFSGWMINKNNNTAFYASLSRDVTGSPVIFNNEILDTDDAYSTSTGKFVAPHSGLYVLIMSGLIYGRYAFNYTFSFRNEISQPIVWVHSTSGYNDSSSYMTFAWMNTGESVYIDAKRMGATSMFAGWLLIDDRNVTKSTFPPFLVHLSNDSTRTPFHYELPHGIYHHDYTTRTGVFTANRDGLYLFLFKTEGQNEVVLTTLRVNGVEIFETRSDGRRSGYDDTSAVTVLQLYPHDRVSIGVNSGTVDGYQSLFISILLYEM